MVHFQMIGNTRTHHFAKRGKVRAEVGDQLSQRLAEPRGRGVNGVGNRIAETVRGVVGFVDLEGDEPQCGEGERVRIRGRSRGELG